jgi:hypothetical protein
MKRALKAIVESGVQGDVLTEYLYQFGLKAGIEFGVVPEKEDARNARLRQGEQKQKSDRQGPIAGFISRVKRAAVDAFRETPRAVSPELYLAGMQLINEVDKVGTALLMHILREKGAITEKTKFYYVKSKPESRDETVLVDQADSKYAQAAADVKAQYQSFTYEGDHAQVYNALGVIKEQFWKDQIARWKKQNTAGDSAV